MSETAPDLITHSDERFRLLVASIRDYAIFMLDPAGRVATWNEGAQRIKGYRADEIIGRHFSRFYPLADVEAGLCDLALATAEREGRFEHEGWRVRNDGTRFWANVVITALRDDGGKLVGFAKVTRDLTERHHAEAQRVALARAEEAQRQRDEFLAMLGHELRNPLAPVLLATEVLKQRQGERCDDAIAVLDRQVRHMARLLDDLADAARALHHDLDLAPIGAEVREALTVPLDMLTPLAAQHGQTVVVDVPASGLPVSVDPARFGQALGNVLRNASKYTPTGGRIVVAASDGGDAVEITVTDTGRGIAPDQLDRIFDAFTQGTHGLGGLGVGLAVARRILRAHGGDIRAESEGLGRGSRFVVRVPKATGPIVSAPVEKTAEPALPQRVLVVDDDADAAELIAHVLEGAGHTVDVARDGPSALDAFELNRPDVVFLDVGLPGMSGLEVARRMRLLSSGAEVAIVAITGYATPSDRARTEAAGFTAHLPKPVSTADLTRALREHGRRRPA